MTDSTHKCPAPGCEHRVPFYSFACRTHWYAIPPLLRARLWREYGRSFGEAPYFAVRAECLASLGVPVDEIADLNGGIPPGGVA